MLPPETRKLWEYLSKQQTLAGFVLIGGSALTLRLRHRISEDLDFLFTGDRLPKARLEVLVMQAAKDGFVFIRNDNEAALEDFEHVGMELHDHQQDFLVNNAVKVSFFVGQGGLEKVIRKTSANEVRLAELDELFKSKCLVSALRSKSRDWLDLYLLFREHGFTVQDYCRVFSDVGLEVNCGIGLARLASGTPQRDDEGYAHLLSKAPSIEDMAKYFSQLRDEMEVQRAAAAFKAKKLPK